MALGNFFRPLAVEREGNSFRLIEGYWLRKTVAIPLAALLAIFFAILVTL